MVKYGIVCIIMKITVTIPDNVYNKLERDRGLIPRSSFIQELIKGWRGSETKRGEFSTEASTVGSNPSDTGSNPVAPAKKSSEPIKSSTPDELVVPPSALKRAKEEGYDTSNYLESELIPEEKEFKTYFKKDGKQK